MNRPKPPASEGIELVRKKAKAMAGKDQAVIATDPAGIVVFWNEKAAELFGWTEEEALGQNVIDLTPTVMQRPEATRIMKHLRSGEPWAGTFALRHRSGTRFTAHVTNTPVYERHGKLVGIVGVTVTENAGK